MPLSLYMSLPMSQIQKARPWIKRFFLKKKYFFLNAVRCKLTRKDRTYSQFTLNEISFHLSRQNFIETVHMVLATKIKVFITTKVVLILGICI